MPTYRVITLGCKVNQYESLQVEQLLKNLGYTPTESKDADVVIVNTCSVTSQAAAKSRNLLRRFARRPRKPGDPPHTIAIGCWATSDKTKAAELLGENAAIGHQGILAEQLPALLGATQFQPLKRSNSRSLPILSERQPRNQRAILKIQDGCDAHCTYCIIPKLRPILWSRPQEEVIAEARNMVSAGHQEIVLTGVFLGAYGQGTALHRRQESPSAHIASLIKELCTSVPGLARLRLSSLEPGDATPELIETLRSFPQVVPHFHLPLQSGSADILRKMNRQYSADDYRRMIDNIRAAFDRPAITTDVIVGFPGETDEDFAATTEMARYAQFLHVHAFPFSPREGTAAARWKRQMIPQRIVTERMNQLQQLSDELSLQFRSQFVGESVELLVEHPNSSDVPESAAWLQTGVQHGRCERYFAVHFESPVDLTGKLVRVRIERVTAQRTVGSLLEPARRAV